MRSAIAGAWAALAAIVLQACSTLPGAGPSAAAMKRSADVELVKVTPALAQQAAAAVAGSDQALAQSAMRALSSPARPAPFTFGPGSSLNVILWSFPPQLATAAAPAATPLGSYTVSDRGEILLPYVGRVRLQGLTLEQARDLIRSRYASLRMFQAPSIAIESATSPQGQIVVTGAIGQPRILPWPAQGMTLAEAVTQSLGDGAALLAVSAESADSTPQVRVVLLREGLQPVELPVWTAMASRIPLQPGDRILVRKAPLVRVSFAGPGVRTNGVMGFAQPPPLLQALAKATGLDQTIADYHAVFVLRQRAGLRPVLYDFAWDRAEGLIAARSFPLQDGDVVYVAAAPIVAIERVVNVLFQLAVPAQTLK